MARAATTTQQQADGSAEVDSAAERASSRTAVPLPSADRVLLLVDVMQPLRDPKLAPLAAQMDAVTPCIAALRQQLRRQGVPSVYVNDNFGDWASDFEHLVALCQRGPAPGARAAKALAPRRGDITLLKPRHSAFLDTPLHLLLTQMGARELVVAGFSTDMCVLMTAADAYQRGFRLWVPADACAAETPQRHVAALRWIRHTLRAEVRRAFAPAPRLPKARAVTPKNRLPG